MNGSTRSTRTTSASTSTANGRCTPAGSGQSGASCGKQPVADRADGRGGELLAPHPRRERLERNAVAQRGIRAAEAGDEIQCQRLAAGASGDARTRELADRAAARATCPRAGRSAATAVGRKQDSSERQGRCGSAVHVCSPAECGHLYRPRRDRISQSLRRVRCFAHGIADYDCSLCVRSSRPACSGCSLRWPRRRAPRGRRSKFSASIPALAQPSAARCHQRRTRRSLPARERHALVAACDRLLAAADSSRGVPAARRSDRERAQGTQYGRRDVRHRSRRAGVAAARDAHSRIRRRAGCDLHPARGPAGGAAASTCTPPRTRPARPACASRPRRCRRR